MNGLVAGLSAALLAGGLVAFVHGLRSKRPTPHSRRRSRGKWRVSRKTARRAVIWAAIGLGVWLLTGWLVLGIAVPLVAVALPFLLATPRNRNLEVLEALDRWVRALAATVPTGRSVTDALRFTRRQAPELLNEALTLLVRRLDERWNPREALLAFADDVGSSDADAVVAALILAAERGGTGLSTTLSALADTVSDRLRAAREVETERAKPRTVVRQVTVVTLVVLAIALVVGHGFFEPYGTPAGQAILAVLVGLYVGSLLALRHLSTEHQRERILLRDRQRL